MKTYVNNIRVESGEITVLMHENAATITNHACTMAKAMLHHNLNVLMVNCATSNGRFKRAHEAHIPDRTPRGGRPYFHAMTAEQGNLAEQKCVIDEVIAFADIDVLIISGWEWTSSSWRRKERLLYLLREWADTKGLVVIVYSQARTEPEVGVYDRGGIGKLAMIALLIQRIDAVEKTRDIPKPPPLIYDQEDIAAAERSAQLLIDQLRSYGEAEESSKDAA